MTKEGNLLKEMLIEDGYLNTSNTKIENQTICSINTNKIHNFIQALNAIKSMKGKEQSENYNRNKKSGFLNSFINLTVNTTTEYDRNISENSLTNANFSREDNLNNFLNNPIERNIEIVNNNIKKKKIIIPEPYMTKAHFPYKMDLILNPLLQKKGKIIKIVEANEKEEDEENDDLAEKLKINLAGDGIRKFGKIAGNSNFISNYNLNINSGRDNANTNHDNLTVVKSKNKCSTAYDSNNDSQNKEKIIEIKNFNFQNNSKIPRARNNLTDYTKEMEPRETKKFELDDLDEVKDINLVEYRIEGVSSAANKKLNISELDIFNLDINFDVSSNKNSQIYNSEKYNKKINKNSKILIVDSELNSSNSNINIPNINSFYNKMSASGAKYFQFNVDEDKVFNNSSLLKKRTNGPKISSLKNSAENNFMHIYSDSINMKNISNGNILNPAERELNTTQKRIRRKYFKSEIFDSNNIKNGESFNYGKNENLYIKKRENFTTNKKIKINKNLINNFNQTEKEFQIDQIDLISDFENTNSVINSGSQIMENNDENNIENTFIEYKKVNNKFQTPLSKVRSHNIINEWTIFKIKNSSFNFSNSKKSSRNEKSGKKTTDGALMMILDDDCEAEESFVDTVFDLEFINNLLVREFYYRPDPGYISKHPRLELMYRSVLVEWLMELCEEFAFKRDTFHYAVNYIDRFLSKYTDISKRSLQLIGVTCLSIAAKFEEIQIPKIEDYLNSTDNSYTQEEFIATERLILKTLKWEIMPTTVNTWLNWYLCQWDLYIDTIPNIKEKLLKTNKEPIFFKKADEQSYGHFRQAAQLIDLFTVDYYSLVHTSRYLVAATLFIVICKIYEIDTYLSFNINKFDYDAKFYQDYFSDNKNPIVEIFSDFLQQSFNFNYDDSELIEALVYASRYLSFEFNYNLPLVMQANNEGIENVKYLNI